MDIQKPTRTFVSESLKITSWESIKPFFYDLLQREIESKDDFLKWLKDKSELEAVIEEEAAWRYIKMTIDTRDEALTKDYTFFVTKIQPELAPLENQLNEKLVSIPFTNELSKEESYHIYFRSVRKALELFRQENVAIEAELNEKSQLFGSITAAQTIEHNGEKLTMQKAAALLRENDESLRKTIFEKMTLRRREDIDKLNDLYSELIQKRHQLAINAGFMNYRDYKFQELGRFDYTKEDCFEFHRAIKTLIVPLVKNIQLSKLQKMKKKAFKPWDTEVDPSGLPPLKPFSKGSDLLRGTINIFKRIDPYFADCIATMNEMKHLDLDSKEGKAPGGYNYPLYEIGVPFIFMNAVGTQNDLVTMVHEGGHAIHSFLNRNLELTAFKNIPSEVAELASMSMELLSMREWNEFYKDDSDLKRAQRDQLESILKILPWIAQIDEFQHWVYENPTHSINERHQQWLQISNEYSTGLTDWTGYEDMQEVSWQRQLHLFEVPFYYIEYGIAQLGALGIWKNSLVNFDQAIENYKKALQLGYTKSMPKIYEAAGIQFNFSADYLKKLATFLETSLAELKN